MPPIPKRDPAKQLTTAELKQFVSDTLASGVSVRRLLVEQSLFLEARARTQSASWVFRYAYGGERSGVKGVKGPQGVRAAMGFGRWPGVGLAEAREKARHARELLSQGVNPVEAKRSGLQTAKQRHIHTVADAVKQWLKGDAEKLTSPKYAAQKERRLLEVLTYKRPPDVSPLGDMPVASVRTLDITGSMDVFLRNGRDARDTYRKVISDLEKAFAWARGKGWRDDANPCEGVIGTVHRPAKQGHRAPGIVDLGDIVRGLRAGQCTDTFDYDTRLALLLLLTGARTSEVRLAQWSEVIALDSDTPRIDVPADRMKKRKAWTVPLSAQAAGLLRELRDNAAQWGDVSPLVFYKYRKTGRGVVSNENAVNVVLRKAGLHDKVVGHGFRKLFSTAAYSLWPYRGNNRERAIEHSLAHVNSETVEQTYNKSEFLPERLLVLQWWADHLDNAAAGEAAGTVLEFKKVLAG